MWSSRRIVLLATLLLVCVDALDGNLHLPEYVPVCSRDDPQLGKCIENSINTLRPHIKAGMPEINIVAAEPLRIPTFTIQRGPANFNIDATISDVVIEGIGDFKITSLSADISKHKFKMSVSFDEMVFSGNYNMSITIFGIPIRGKGIVNGTLPNQHTDMSLKGEKVTRDGVDYLHITGGKMRFIFNEVKLYMSNLFNADPVISRLYQRIINENSKAFMDEISPALQASTAARFVSASNALTSRLPYDELFPARTQQP